MANRFVRPLIKRQFGKIVTETPYNEGWITAIKQVVPSGRRSYENGGVWMFDPQYYTCVREITEHHFGTAYIDATGGVVEPQTSEWKERWAAWKSVCENEAKHHKKAHEEERYEPPRSSHRSSSAFATLYVAADAPKEIITAAWRALNAMLRKDDPDGSINHEALARVNGAYQELKKLGRV